MPTPLRAHMNTLSNLLRSKQSPCTSPMDTATSVECAPVAAARPTMHIAANPRVHTRKSCPLPLKGCAVGTRPGVET
jgi:hypothetical protein